MKARKKAIEIECVPISEAVAAAKDGWDNLPGWVEEAYNKGDIVFTDSGVYVNTAEGKMFGLRKDMLMRGVEGELYPCNAEIFAKSYDIVPVDNGGLVPIHEAEGDPTRLEWSRQAGHADDVIAFKIAMDAAIAKMQMLRTASTGEKARCASIAITELETACMWGVKGFTA